MEPLKHHLGRNVKWYSHSEKRVVVSLKTKNVLIWPRNCLGNYPRKKKLYVHIKNCIWMFITAFFISSKTWKQSKCPSMVKPWYIHAMDYYLAIIRNKLYTQWPQWISRNYAKWKKSISKGYILYDSIPTFLEEC